MENIDLIKGNTAIGLHIETDGDAETYYLLKLERKAKSISLVDKSTGDKEHIFSWLPNNVPVYVSVDGKGLIHKKVQGGIDNHSAKNVFPNIQLNAFYIQYRSVDDNQTFISLVRKNKLTALLQPFMDARIPVAELVLGPFTFSNIMPLMDHGSSTAVFNLVGQTIKTADGKLVEISKNASTESTQYNIAGEVLDGADLLPFSNALMHYNGMSDAATIWEEKPDLNKGEWLYAKTNKLIGKALIIAFLIVLLSNFLVYSSLSGKVATLEGQQAQYEEILSKKESAQQELEMKKELLARSGFSGTFHFSKYADMIASTVPGNITLAALKINPPEDKLKREKELEFANGIIHIEGHTSSSSSLSYWNDVMKEWDWVREVNIMQFYKADDKNLFTIEIKLN